MKNQNNSEYRVLEEEKEAKAGFKVIGCLLITIVIIFIIFTTIFYWTLHL